MSFSVLCLLALLQSLFCQSEQAKRQVTYPSDLTGPIGPSASNAGFQGQTYRGNLNRFEADYIRGPSGNGPPGFGASGPPGLSGGGPPGLGGGGPPGLNRKPGWGKPNRGNNRGNGHGRPWNRPDKDDGYPKGDEDYEDNNNKKCGRNEYQCGSGECLPESARCNNRADCRDASDEADCIAHQTEQPGCVLPEQPTGGSYELGGCGPLCRKRPGDKVPLNSILTFKCRDSYVLSGNTISVCVNGEWYQPPTCLKTCHPLSSTSVEISCTYQGLVVPCHERVKPGTRASLSCKPSYRLPVTNDPGYREITCLEDGLWDHRVFRCLPECGTTVAQGNTLIVNGFDAKLGVFPWHVGIYRKKSPDEYEQICGGTLISNNLVVSAAHCFFDETHNRVQDASYYAVGAGKNERSWDAEEDYAQRSLVEHIKLADRYIGARGNFAQDIALLKVKKPFELTALVRPVCMDWDNVYEREQLQVGKSGKAVGWGKTAQGTFSDVLQEINMPFVPYDQCLSTVPADFRGYITSDKFCAGQLNGSSLCEGDSGGGLCFEKQGVWYIRGIVSVSPVRDDSCDYNSYVAFTYVSHFRDWIRSIYVTA